MPLTKRYLETFTPAVPAVDYRPYSRVCPPAPTPGAPASTSTSGADSGLPTGCVVKYFPPDPNAGYGAQGVYLTVCQGTAI